MNWQTLISSKRLGKENRQKPLAERRTEFQRDYDRLIFSAAFRRMQNKTQVFPLPGSVFVHNRLTHSLEVSSVGRSLGTDISRVLVQRHPELADTEVTGMGAIVSAACLAHDMGNPPFGHSGERAIRTYFSEGRGRALHDHVSADGQRLTEEEWLDMTRFDGNANTFRLLTHHFNGRRRGGFVMTYATLASIVKYPYGSDRAVAKPKFGFFESERRIFLDIAAELGLRCLEDDGGSVLFARHPLVYLVEAADDICYEIMDIEDAHKLKILTTQETQQLLLGFFDDDKREEIIGRMHTLGDVNEQIVYLRSCVINCLETECVKAFVEHEDEIMRGTFQGPLIKAISQRPRQAYEACEAAAMAKIYHCSEVVDVEIAGFQVITTLTDLMVQAVTNSDKAYSKRLISRVSTQYDILAPTLYGRIMAVLDYISGMTDVYALDLYRKINGMSLPIV